MSDWKFIFPRTLILKPCRSSVESRKILSDLGHLYGFGTLLFAFLGMELFLPLLKDLLRTNSTRTWPSFSLIRLLRYFLLLIIMKKAAIEELTSNCVVI